MQLFFKNRTVFWTTLCYVVFIHFAVFSVQIEAELWFKITKQTWCGHNSEDHLLAACAVAFVTALWMG